MVQDIALTDTTMRRYIPFGWISSKILKWNENSFGPRMYVNRSALSIHYGEKKKIILFPWN